MEMAVSDLGCTLVGGRQVQGIRDKRQEHKETDQETVARHGK
jgi:hypothetical protein